MSEYQDIGVEVKENRNRPNKSDRKQHSLEPIVVEKSELAYVTSIHLPTKTFFAQLCKNTMEELLELDNAVNNHCNKLLEQTSEDNEKKHHQLFGKKVHSGDLVCLKFHDGLWYRSLVLERNKIDQFYVIQLIDYGNILVVQRDEILALDKSDCQSMECFKRQPFGISCYIEGTNGVSQDMSDRALNCLYSSYLLINVKLQQTKQQYMVDIPKVAYNMPFWDKFDPKTVEKFRNYPQLGRAIQAGEHLDRNEESQSEQASASMFPGP